MRALVLGAAGMLGHRLWRELDGEMDAFATVNVLLGERSA